MGHAPVATLFYGIVEPEVDTWSPHNHHALDGDDRIPDLGVERGFFGVDYSSVFLAITESLRTSTDQLQPFPAVALTADPAWERRLLDACQRLHIQPSAIGWYLVVAW